MNPQHIVYLIFILLSVGIIMLAWDPLSPKSIDTIKEHCGLKDRLVECLSANWFAVGIIYDETRQKEVLYLNYNRTEGWVNVCFIDYSCIFILGTSIDDYILKYMYEPTNTYTDSGLTMMTNYEYKVSVWDDYEQYFEKRIAELRGLA